MTSEVTTTQFPSDGDPKHINVPRTGDPSKMWLFPQNTNSHLKKKLEDRDACYWDWQHLVKL